MRKSVVYYGTALGPTTKLPTSPYMEEIETLPRTIAALAMEVRRQEGPTLQGESPHRALRPVGRDRRSPVPAQRQDITGPYGTETAVESGHHMPWGPVGLLDGVHREVMVLGCNQEAALATAT